MSYETSRDEYHYPVIKFIYDEKIIKKRSEFHDEVPTASLISQISRDMKRVHF